MSSLHNLLYFIILFTILFSDILNAKTIYDFTAVDINGKTISFAKYKGKYLLIVNVASQCGYTDTNYKFFNHYYQTFNRDNEQFAIAAFPCNQV